MKCGQSLVLTCVICLPLLVEAVQLVEPLGATAKAHEPEKRADPAPTTITVTPIQASSTPSAFTTSSSKPAAFSTLTNLIEVSSFMTSIAQSSTSVVSVPAVATVSTDPSATSSLSASSAFSQGSDGHRTLIIILSSVLGSVGTLLIAGALFLAYRFGQKRNPFGRRSVTPLDDEEIDSWRGTVIEQKQRLSDLDTKILHRQNNSIQMQPSPGWSWTASPTSVGSGLSPTTTVPDTPVFLAKAPNSRSGLTDETIAGADPFIPPLKRQSSRLSKASRGHGRSKSKRSSISAKSFSSYDAGIGPNPSDKSPHWYDADDHAIGIAVSPTDRMASSAPVMSRYDDVAAGLSPRPIQTRPFDKEIGRAIA